MTNKFKISQAADFLGVSTKTLRRWDAAGKLIAQKTNGGQRFYTRTQLEGAMNRKISQGSRLAEGKADAFLAPTENHPSEVKSFDYSSSFNAVAGQQYKEKVALDEVRGEGRRLFSTVQQKSPLLGYPSGGLMKMFGRSLAFATLMSLLLLVYDVSGFWGRSYARGLPAVAGGLLAKFSGSTFLEKTSRIREKSSLSAAKTLPTSQVLAATDMNLPFHLAVSVPAIFSENITAPNVIYSITAGDGITIVGDQDLTISGSGNNWLSMKVGSTTLTASGTSDIFEYAGSGSVSLALDTTNKKLTITGSTDASTLGGVAIGSLLRSDTSDSYTSGTLTFADGTLLDLSAILHDDTTAQGLLLPQNTSLTAPATGEGYIAYNTTDNQMYIYDGTEWKMSGYWILNNTDLYVSNTSYNLGIGNTSPVTKLDVTGGLNVSGNVGVGVTAPAYKVDVLGTLQVTGSGFTGLRLPTGAEENYVLTTDGQGNSSWTNTTGSGSFGAWTLTGSTIYPNLTTYNLVLGSTDVLDSVAKLVNTGSTLYKPLAVADLPSGGALGTAAATVDVYTSFNVTQTTASQTITLPTPTSSIAGRLVYISNTGTTPFTFLSSTVTAGTTTQAMWNGTAWTLAGSNAGLPVGTVNNTTMRWNTATSTWQENTSVTATSTGTLSVLGTSEQFRLSYDASNYMSFTIGSTGNLVLSDSGTTVATLGSELASFNVPTEFTAAGDVSIAYDLVFTNQSTAGIYSYGPMIIESGESFENNNLTLKTYGTGDIFLDMGGNLLLQSADPAIVFDTLTATDTDYWMGVIENADATDNDVFSIGKGVGIGTSAYFTINTSGYVGIGITNPSVALHIGGSGNVIIDGLTASSGVYTDANKQLTSSAPTTGVLGFWTRTDTTVTPTTSSDNIATLGSLGVGVTSPARKIEALDASNAQLRLTHTAGTYYTDFQTTSAGNLYINPVSGGKVGIGTTSPQATLGLTSTTEQLRLSYNASNYLSFTIGSTGNLTLADSGTSVAMMGSEGAEFYVPTTFSAAGDVSIAYDIIMANQSQASIISKGPFSLEAGQVFENNNLTLKTYGTGDIFLDMGGNLLLQSADPAIVFDTLTATDTDYWMGVIENADATDNDVFSIGKGVGIGTSAYFTLNSSGYVGIGTTAPLTKLEVNGGYQTNYGGFLINGNTSHAFLGLMSASGSNSGIFLNDGSTLYWQIKNNGAASDVLQLVNQTTTVMTLNQSANVGIGTTAPGTKLGIVGGVGIGTTDSFANAAIAANNLAVQGNLGVGTTSPTLATAQIYNTATASANGSMVLGLAGKMSSTAGSGPYMGFFNDSFANETGRIWNKTESTSNIALTFSTFNSSLSEKMRITAAGNVGVGTTVPGAKLSIAGGVGIGTTDSFANAAVAANTLAVQGRIGVGISAPTSALYVHNNPGLGNETQKAAFVVDQYEDQDLLTASASGTTKFAVSNTGTIYMGDNTTLSTSTAVCWEAATLNGDDAVYKLGDCTGSPADLAEFYPVKQNIGGTSEVTGTGSSDGLPVAAEIVSIAEAIGTYQTSDGVTHQAFAVEKATADTAHKMAGIVSTKAWQVIGEDVLEWAEHAVPVALTGRVPLKIAPSSAPILAGDMITVSDDVPGAGKKSDGNGYIVGKALEDWNGDKETILVFLQNSVNIAGVLADDRITNLEAEVELLKAANLSQAHLLDTQEVGFSGDLSISNLTVLDSSVLGDVTITGNLTIASLSDINFNNNIIIDQKGNLTIKEGVILGNDNFRGEVTIPSGQNQIFVAKSWTNVPVSITITPSWNTTVWISEKSTTGFTINFGTAPSGEATANWLAVF